MSDSGRDQSPRSRSSHRHRERSRDRDVDQREDKFRYRDGERRQHRRRRSDSRSPDRRYEREPRSSHKHDRDRHERRRHRSGERGTRSRSPRRDPPVRPTSPSRALDKKPVLGAESEEPIEKQRPNFNASGKLAAESNKVSGTEIVLKYNEPPEARKPPASQAWRLYVFKGKETLDEVDLFLRSCWLFGRERMVADYYVESPSVSKQHAVVQFRHIEKRNEFGDRIGSVKPYVIDLDSANGTIVNGSKIPSSRYYELRNGDVITFGDSAREYVFMLPPKG